MSTAIQTRPMQWRLFWRSRDAYWSRAEQHKHEAGSFPEWVFDFISIHNHHTGGFRLLSPMCIVDKNHLGNRPRWEGKTFDTLGQAIATATRLARMYARTIDTRIHVVYCPTPTNS